MHGGGGGGGGESDARVTLELWLRQNGRNDGRFGWREVVSVDRSDVRQGEGVDVVHARARAEHKTEVMLTTF